jgi:hypothetical protein
VIQTIYFLKREETSYKIRGKQIFTIFHRQWPFLGSIYTLMNGTEMKGPGDRDLAA